MGHTHIHKHSISFTHTHNTNTHVVSSNDWIAGTPETELKKNRRLNISKFFFVFYLLFTVILSPGDNETCAIVDNRKLIQNRIMKKKEIKNTRMRYATRVDGRRIRVDPSATLRNYPPTLL